MQAPTVVSDYAAAHVHWLACKQARADYEKFRDSLPDPSDMSDHDLMYHYHLIHSKLMGDRAQDFYDFQRERTAEHEAIQEDEAQSNTSSYQEHGPMILQLALEQMMEEEEDREWTAAFNYAVDVFGEGCLYTNEVYWWACGPIEDE